MEDMFERAQEIFGDMAGAIGQQIPDIHINTDLNANLGTHLSVDVNGKKKD